MWMTDYIREIQKRFITEYGFPEDPERPGIPLPGIPDGDYPMVIDGKKDNVKIVHGFVQCGNFEEAKS